MTHTICPPVRVSWRRQMDLAVWYVCVGGKLELFRDAAAQVTPFDIGCSAGLRRLERLKHGQNWHAELVRTAQASRSMPYLLCELHSAHLDSVVVQRSDTLSRCLRRITILDNLSECCVVASLSSSAGLAFNNCHARVASFP